jgi:deazaflavin-dependent oxidoreductase (nitroreductase family)
MVEADERNRAIIQEFRSNGGRVASFSRQPLLLLHHLGARSGRERVSPLAYQELEGGYAVFGSKGGAPSDPRWVSNLLARPDVTIEIGDQVLQVRARMAREGERERIWEEQKRRNPAFAEYEARAGRRIPVVILEPRRPSDAV